MAVETCQGIFRDYSPLIYFPKRPENTCAHQEHWAQSFWAGYLGTAALLV